MPDAIRSEAETPERRVHGRADLDVGVDLTTETNFYTGFSEDISEGGLFVATVMLREIGTRLSLLLSLPDGTEIQVTGVVRWLRDPVVDEPGCSPGMGIEFVDLTGDDIATIRRFLAVREPMFYA